MTQSWLYPPVVGPYFDQGRSASGDSSGNGLNRATLVPRFALADSPSSTLSRNRHWQARSRETPSIVAGLEEAATSDVASVNRDSGLMSQGGYRDVQGGPGIVEDEDDIFGVTAALNGAALPVRPVTHDVSAVQASMNGPVFPSSSAPHWQPQSLVLHGPGKAWTSPLQPSPLLDGGSPYDYVSSSPARRVASTMASSRGIPAVVYASEPLKSPLFAPQAGDIVALARMRGASSRRCVEAQAPPAVELSDRSPSVSVHRSEWGQIPASDPPTAGHGPATAADIWDTLYGYD